MRAEQCKDPYVKLYVINSQFHPLFQLSINSLPQKQGEWGLCIPEEDIHK